MFKFSYFFVRKSKIMKERYKGLQIVIVGLGITGLSCIHFFLNRGVIPKVIDTRLFPPYMNKIPNFVQCYFGKLYDIWILNADLIVVSPGVSLNYPVFVEAKKLGIEIIGDIELFVREVNVPIIAITGSNGKSTVTQLVGNMAKSAGWDVGVAGNIGIPVLNLLNKKYQLYVLELSSFQLDVTYSLQAMVATILNVSEDHMDRYIGGLKQYSLSKQKIYDNAVTCVINALDPLTKPMLSNYDSVISFSAGSDSADYRLEYYKGHYWIIAFNEYVINCSILKAHNYISYDNILSALALSDSIKIPRFVSLKSLQYFYGLPHRFQIVYKNNDIKWINDSKSTNVSSTIKAIQNTITILLGRLHLLLGGDGKSAEFFPIKSLIMQYDIHLYCFGKDGIFLTKLGYNNVILTDTMQDAVHIISRRIRKKDVVLLSPACSSIDQFMSFEDRGNRFVYFVQKLSVY